MVKKLGIVYLFGVQYVFRISIVSDVPSFDELIMFPINEKLRQVT